MREQRHRAVRGQTTACPPGQLTNLLSNYIPGGGQSPPHIYLGFVLAQGTQEPGDARSIDRSLRVSGCFYLLLFVLSCILPSRTLLSSAGRCHRLCAMHTASAGLCCPGPTMHCATTSYTKLNTDLWVSLTSRNQLWVPDRNKISILVGDARVADAPRQPEGSQNRPQSEYFSFLVLWQADD